MEGAKRDVVSKWDESRNVKAALDLVEEADVVMPASGSSLSMGPKAEKK